MNADLSRLAIHTRTIRAWNLRECCAHFAAAGVAGISVWRELIDPAAGGVEPAEAGRMIADAGLKPVALVRAGFFVSPEAAHRSAAVDDARRAIEHARAIGAGQVVVVPGAAPGVPLDAARAMVADALAAVADDARSAAVRLALEPLHPMYAADRSCLNTLAAANTLCDDLDHPAVGIAVDPYHLWWEPGLEQQIARAGVAGRLLAVHLCDWRTPLRDPLNDRGLMGDGCIDLPSFIHAADSAGFTGPLEVEVFSEHYWAMNPNAFLSLIIERYAALRGETSGS